MMDFDQIIREARASGEKARQSNGSADPETEEQAETVAVQPWPDPLGEDAYHGIVGDIVRRIEPETEADPGRAAVPAAGRPWQHHGHPAAMPG